MSDQTATPISYTITTGDFPASSVYAVPMQPLYPPAPHVKHLTFRSSRIIYYGPHACANCGVLICKMGHEFGGNAFTYPEGPIYPNTEWHPHVCDPKVVAAVSCGDTHPINVRCRGDGIVR